MPTFSITLKNDRVRWYNQLSWIMLSLLTLIFIYLCFFPPDEKTRNASIVILVILAICFGLRSWFKKTPYRIGFYPFFMILFAGMFSIGWYWLSLLPFVFSILSDIATRRQVITFGKKGIRLHTFPYRYINWKEVSNVILKDGLLTIDLENNKLIQQPVDETETRINEPDFNEFCREQLAANA